MIKNPQTLEAVYIYISVSYKLKNVANEVSFVCDEKNMLKIKAICR